MPVQTGFGKSGVPDHLFCVPIEITPEMVGETYGMFVAVEAKRSKKTPTQNQYRELSLILKTGGLGLYVAGLEALPHLEATLKERFCQK